MFVNCFVIERDCNLRSYGKQILDVPEGSVDDCSDLFSQGCPNLTPAGPEISSNAGLTRYLSILAQLWRNGIKVFTI